MPDARRRGKKVRSSLSQEEADQSICKGSALPTIFIMIGGGSLVGGGGGGGGGHGDALSGYFDISCSQREPKSGAI